MKVCVSIKNLMDCRLTRTHQAEDHQNHRSSSLFPRASLRCAAKTDQPLRCVLKMPDKLLRLLPTLDGFRRLVEAGVSAQARRSALGVDQVVQLGHDLAVLRVIR